MACGMRIKEVFAVCDGLFVCFDLWIATFFRTIYSNASATFSFDKLILYVSLCETTTSTTHIHIHTHTPATTNKRYIWMVSVCRHNTVTVKGDY